MKPTTKYQLNDRPKANKFVKTTKAAAWFVVAGSQLFGAYVLLLNFHRIEIVVVGVFQALMGLGIVVYNFYKSNE